MPPSMTSYNPFNPAAQPETSLPDLNGGWSLEPWKTGPKTDGVPSTSLPEAATRRSSAALDFASWLNKGSVQTPQGAGMVNTGEVAGAGMKTATGMLNTAGEVAGPGSKPTGMVNIGEVAGPGINATGMVNSGVVEGMVNPFYPDFLSPQPVNVLPGKLNLTAHGGDNGAGNLAETFAEDKDGVFEDAGEGAGVIGAGSMSTGEFGPHQLVNA